MIRLPSIFVLRPLLGSILVIWFACHLVVLAVFSVGGPTFQEALWPGPTASVFIVPSVPFLFLLDLRIKRLDVFLANLGISRALLFWGAFFSALCFEVLGSLIAGILTVGPIL